MPHRYPAALKVATDAALQAGDLLRDEFYRPGGPRGSGGHAPIDDVAEQVIRDVLRAAFPHWPIYGEELGRLGTFDTDDPHIWLVDPNDGTSSFIKGYRGSAVSIALLRDGVPVLGVVYAFAAPDSNGDLITWAEGCGPVTRNGQPVNQELPGGAITDKQIVLLSTSASRSIGRLRANAEACAPARFITMPSIAYRLALVAVGDADAAVTLNGPVGYDYAAGHALLRGVGGDLLNENAQRVTYTPDGNSSLMYGFGGSSSMAADLASRNWGAALYASTGPAPGPFQLHRPTPGHVEHDDDRLSRAQGCLLGQLAGDALGSLVEFRRASSILAQYPGGVRDMADGGCWNTIAGQPTDDSELALMLARSLVTVGHYDEDQVAAAYGAWYDSGPFDIGTTTTTGLSAASRAVASGTSPASDARQAAQASMSSQSNGALMRISPLGILGHDMDPSTLGQLARRDATLAHPNTVCQDSNAVFAASIAYAVLEKRSPGEVHDFAVDLARREKVDASVLHALLDAAQEPPPDYYQHMGWVLTALQNAFYRLLHSASLEDAVIETVMAGGDTDTTGAIAGALLGAVHGQDAVPRRWRRAVLTCRPLDSLSGVNQARPAAFWPVDALELAEALL